MIIRKRYGRTITLDPKVLLWRKRMKQFKQLRIAIAQLLIKAGYDKQGAEAWLKTPHPDLGGKCPKDFLNPTNIAALYNWSRKQLRK